MPRKGQLVLCNPYNHVLKLSKTTSILILLFLVHYIPRKQSFSNSCSPSQRNVPSFSLPAENWTSTSLQSFLLKFPWTILLFFFPLWRRHGLPTTFFILFVFSGWEQQGSFFFLLFLMFHSDDKDVGQCSDFTYSVFVVFHLEYTLGLALTPYYVFLF